ncbi:MAG: preprotein translocase subunit SecG [Betaproteobacteria bacterium]
MSVLESAVLMLHLLTAVAICGFVLLQHGKGADMGAAFGSGSSGSVFGSAGSANFLSRTTAVLAAVFFMSSIALTYYGTQHSRVRGGGGLMERATISEPAKPGEATGTPAKAGDATGAPATPAAPAGNAVAPSKSSEVPK